MPEQGGGGGGRKEDGVLRQELQRTARNADCSASAIDTTVELVLAMDPPRTAHPAAPMSASDLNLPRV